MASTRVWLQKRFQTSGIQTESAALKLLVPALEDYADPSSMLGLLLDHVETRTEDRKLTVNVVNDFLSRLKGSDAGVLEVVDAFQVPLIQYDPVRHMFHRNTGPRKTIGDVKNKFQLYQDRFLLIQQRLKRNAMFRPTKWGDLSRRQGDMTAELTELKSLLGHERQRRFVCGFLTKHDEGQYYLEDLSARLPIDLTGCDTADGLFTENSVVVAEGELQPGGEFRAVALGLPPAESREESIEALQGHDMFGASVQSVPGRDDMQVGEDDGDRIVIMSDVHLDDPATMENLNKVLDGFASMPKPPSAFVLMGNFQTCDARLSKMKEHFTRLGRLISKYPSIVQHSEIILVPGPKDIGIGHALPRHGIPSALAQNLIQLVPRTTLASNPCRIRFKGSDLVLFRSNLQQLLRGLCILPPPMPPSEGTESENDYAKHASFFFDQTCSTIIQESHLCPVPLEYQPISWEWDHAMYVYPNPHGLVLADAEPAARSIFDTCDCINPGSLSKGTFSAWNPSEQAMELCDVNISMEEEEEEGEDDEEEEEDVVLMEAEQDDEVHIVEEDGANENENDIIPVEDTSDPVVVEKKEVCESPSKI